MTTTGPDDHDAFEHFFPEEMRDDDTDPGGAPAAAAGASGPGRRGLAAPLSALAVAVLALAVVGGLILRQIGDGNDATAASSNPETLQASTSAPSPTTPSTSETPSSSSTPSTTTSTSTSTQSAPSSSAPYPTALPGGITRCSATVGAGARTSCPFALAVAAQAGGAQGSNPFTITAHSPTTGKDYTLTCTPGEYVVCTTPSGASVTIVRA